MISETVAAFIKEKNIELDGCAVIGWNATKEKIQFVCQNRDHFEKLADKYPMIMQIDAVPDEIVTGVLPIDYQELDKDAKPLKDTHFGYLKRDPEIATKTIQSKKTQIHRR